MTQLTRRRDKDRDREGWFVYFGDVRVGHIGLRAGVPTDAPQWGWMRACGFYPGCDPRQLGVVFRGNRKMRIFSVYRE